MPIFDGSLSHDYHCIGEVYVLVIRSALYLPLIFHNLTPPAIMKADGVTINDVPKTHYEDHVVNNHVISFECSVLWIPLKLNIVFSHFYTRVSTERELHEREKLSLTLDSSD